MNCATISNNKVNRWEEKTGHMAVLNVFYMIEYNRLDSEVLYPVTYKYSYCSRIIKVCLWFHPY